MTAGLGKHKAEIHLCIGKVRVPEGRCEVDEAAVADVQHQQDDAGTFHPRGWGGGKLKET